MAPKKGVKIVAKKLAMTYAPVSRKAAFYYGFLFTSHKSVPFYDH